MKTLKTLALAMVAFTTISASAQSKKKVDVSKSKITWVGKKVTGEHSGTVNLRDGLLTFKGDKLSGGSFTVDMNSITVTDLEAGKGKEKLEGHLKNDDFFGVDKFDTATLVFTTVTPRANNVYAVRADLTIKGKTQPVGFDMTISGNTAKAKFNIDRTKHDIKYGSGSFFDNLGDKAISDDFEVTANLVF